MRDTPDMREMSVSEQRYLAVLAVIRDGDTVTDVAARFGVSRKTLHVWLSRYEAGGLGAATPGVRARPSGCGSGAVGSRGVSGVGSVEPDRPGGSSASGPEVEAVGTWDADGVVADGYAGLAAAQAELDEWVEDYNTNRPHQGIGMDTPVQRFQRDVLAPVTHCGRLRRRGLTRLELMACG